MSHSIAAYASPAMAGAQHPQQDPRYAPLVGTTRSNAESRQELLPGAVSDQEVGRLEMAVQSLQHFWANQIFHPL